jgi:hypothetical protein
MPWLFLICFLFSALYGGRVENTFHIEGDVYWMKRVKGTTLDVIDYGGTFCDSDQSINVNNIMTDMNRQFVGVITAFVRPNTLNTLEAIATTPANFMGEKSAAANDAVNVNCDIAYGYFLNANDANPLATPLIDFSNTDYTSADKAKGQYYSTMFTDQLNFWWHLTPQRINYFSVGFAFGLRYLNLNETYKETFYKNTSSSFFNVHCTSNMWGIQGLGYFEMNPYKWLTWGIQIKGAWLGVNLGRQTQMWDNNSTTLLTNRSTHSVNHGWLGEGTIYLKGYFMKCFNWTLVGDGLWLRGAALATNNINLTQKVMPIRTNQNIIFASWGAGLGVDF